MLFIELILYKICAPIFVEMGACLLCLSKPCSNVSQFCYSQYGLSTTG
jgi:hypothetical protein